MFVLGLQGSPRKKGNTDRLLGAFMQAATEYGAATRTLVMSSENIAPCRGCGYCEKKGVCVIRDDFMSTEGFALVRRADVLVSATPVFFYNMTAQLKAFVDRCQTFWSRKYVFGLKDPLAAWRKGVLLSVGASSGRNLFEAIELSNRYFFDAVDAQSSAKLLYRKVEKAGDIQKIAALQDDIEKLAKNLLQPLMKRKRVLFLSPRDAGRSQMAWSFAAAAAGDRLAVNSAGTEPAAHIDPHMEAVMAAKGFDLHYRAPQPIAELLKQGDPDLIVSFGKPKGLPSIERGDLITWDFPDPRGLSPAAYAEMCDRVEQQVAELVSKL